MRIGWVHWAGFVALGAVALAACDGRLDAAAQPSTKGPAPALRGLAPFPLGTQLISDELQTPIIADLARRVLEQEHRLYPTVIGWFATGRLRYRDGAAWLDGRPLPEPQRLDTVTAEA